MKLTHDPTLNIAYIRLREPAGEVETVHISDELNVDLAPDGSIYGIELLNANEQLGAQEPVAIVKSASGSGNRIEIYRDKTGEYRVRGLRPNGEPLWLAGPFTGKAEAVAAVEEMRKGFSEAELADLTAA
ncbi:DUF2283 domain-containing protein [Ancylobacter radicis]|uniref:DUF2283 domain-containing protein n=1 Tax=Ancylobacter radicis TaxID=2836179 RepID=A0ABS5R1T8_9HYPH|nr:DUF2283 domain-containing protein [Ancylobacter radicis]MBS9475630.1 DUF2283 domain-containing protein [Ancylobacter radicis]